jgi:hypothetical protein
MLGVKTITGAWFFLKLWIIRQFNKVEAGYRAGDSEND